MPSAYLKKVLCFFIILLSWLAGIHAQQRLAGSKPNIIFILADDMGYNDPSCYGHPYFKTPNIDALAAGGWRFTNGYVNAPNCAPSRACLMTGRFTPVHKIYTVGSSERGKAANRKLVPVKNNTVLDTSFYTIAEMLREAGYDCDFIGKWHLGEGAFGPQGQGFDYNAGGSNSGGVHSHFNYKKEIPGFDDIPDSIFLADAMTDKAVERIKQQRSRPYFLYLPYYSVHTPVQAPKQLIEKHKKLVPAGAPYPPVYAAMMENLDDNVGRIIAAVKERGKTANTLIVFFSDNGPLLNYTTVNLRGEKGTLYEGGIKEPLIINWQGHLPPGKTINEPVSAVDFYPTFAALAGFKKQLPDLDGKSLVPLFQNRPLQQKTMMWHFPAYLERNRKDGPLWRETPASAIREGKWKLVVHYETGSYELYDVVADPKEQHNVYAKNKKQAEVLKKKLGEYLLQTRAFIPKAINPAYKGE